MGAHPVRAFLYARVSTQDKGQDPENQLPEMRRSVKIRNWQLRHEYIDHASAGGKKVREQFDEMLEACDRGEADVILIWALDRLSREGPLKTLLLVNRLERAGVRVKSMREPWLDPESPTYELLLPIFAWIAKQERQRLSERVLAGLERAKQNGAQLGRPALGDTAEIVALRAQKLSIRAIAKKVGLSPSAVADKLKSAQKAVRKTHAKMRSQSAHE
jgi:DNA invertase Pin-like site-specific DNA recombinase